MPLRFRIRTVSPAGEPTERLLEVEPVEGVVFVGRYRGSHIELPLPAVSGRHARLVRQDTGWVVEDLGSANGTFRNECRLLPERPEPIVAGDVIGLAGVELVFEGEDAVARTAGSGQAVESTATLARRLVGDLFGACRPADLPRLVVAAAPARELKLPSLGRGYVVGRGASCDLALADDDVSRRHAEVERRWDGVYVRDLGSKNGTYVDGESVGAQRKLHDGAVLQLGRLRLQFEYPEERYMRQLEEAEAAERAQGEARAGAALAGPADASGGAVPAPVVEAPDPTAESAPDPTAESAPDPAAVGGPASDTETLPVVVAPAPRPRVPVSHIRPGLAAALAGAVLLAVAGLAVTLVLWSWR